MVVYEIENLTNGKKYIGATSNYRARIRTHMTGRGGGYIGNAIQKYGKQYFKARVIDKAVNPQDLMELEKYHIATTRTRAPNGYNLTNGGELNNVISTEIPLDKNIIYSRIDQRGSSKSEAAMELLEKLLPACEQALKSLSTKQKKIIKMRYGFHPYESHSLAEIAQKISVTRERVRQIAEISLEKLRHPIISRQLSKYRTKYLSNI